VPLPSDEGFDPLTFVVLAVLPAAVGRPDPPPRRVAGVDVVVTLWPLPCCRGVAGRNG
jgi:hypothetical protein